MGKGEGVVSVAQSAVVLICLFYSIGICRHPRHDSLVRIQFQFMRCNLSKLPKHPCGESGDISTLRKRLSMVGDLVRDVFLGSSKGDALMRIIELLR